MMIKENETGETRDRHAVPAHELINQLRDDEESAINKTILYMPRGKPIISSQKTNIIDLMQMNSFKERKTSLEQYQSPLGINTSILQKNNLRLLSGQPSSASLFKNNKIKQSQQQQVVERLT